jgi:hypothetical protein
MPSSGGLPPVECCWGTSPSHAAKSRTLVKAVPLPTADWGEVFNDQTLATAILDRLLHHATTVNIKGDSYRLREKKKAGLLGRKAKPPTEAEEEVSAEA